MTYVLWTLQALLALVFLLAGSMKLVMPIDELTALFPLPGLVLRCIGVAEVLGALGLILPGLFRIRPNLTPLAAAELAQVMLGATIITLATSSDATQAVIPFVVGLMAVFVTYGRWRLAPHRAQRAASRNAAFAL
jgi:uncharacterized membrane protein YphA (DoxX/SURF4 family)